MCQIIVCQKRLPTLEELEKFESTNRHGAGVAWSSKGSVRYVKGLKGAEEVRRIIEKEKVTPPAVIHFRLASSGRVCPELTHPFIISEDVNENPLESTTKNPVLFFNGTERDVISLFVNVLAVTKKKIKNDISDAYAMAKLAGICGEGILSLFSGKIVVLNPDCSVKIYGNTFDEGDFVVTSYCGHGYYYDYNLNWRASRKKRGMQWFQE